VCNRASKVLIMRGAGDGEFARHGEYLAPDGAQQVALADLNGDGRVDVVTGNQYSSDGVSVWFGGPGATLSARTDYAVGRVAGDLVAGDLDADGDADLVFGSYENGSVLVMLGSGAGRFGPADELVSRAWVGGLAIDDVNHDGRPDLVAAAFNDTVMVFAGLSQGGLGRTVYHVGGNPYSVALGDLDDDGDIDFVTANSLDRSVSPRLNWLIQN
jgi:hypothetical protein